eukprot:1004619-Prymnesium_polylepis.1
MIAVTSASAVSTVAPSVPTFDALRSMSSIKASMRARERPETSTTVLSGSATSRSNSMHCASESCVTSFAVAPVAGKKVPPTPSTSSRRVAFAYAETVSSTGSGCA